jgi:hypothetical protein
MMRTISSIAAFWRSLSLMDRLYLLGLPVFGYAVLFHIFSIVMGPTEISHGGDLYGWSEIYPEQTCSTYPVDYR